MEDQIHTTENPCGGGLGSDLPAAGESRSLRDKAWRLGETSLLERRSVVLLKWCQRRRRAAWIELLRQHKGTRLASHMLLWERSARFGRLYVSRCQLWWVVWTPSPRCGYISRARQYGLRTSAIQAAKKLANDDQT